MDAVQTYYFRTLCSVVSIDLGLQWGCLWAYSFGFEFQIFPGNSANVFIVMLHTFHRQRSLTRFSSRASRANRMGFCLPQRLTPVGAQRRKPHPNGAFYKYLHVVCSCYYPLLVWTKITRLTNDSS
jgi:hypothetical protein